MMIAHAVSLLLIGLGVRAKVVKSFEILKQRATIVTATTLFGKCCTRRLPHL